MNEKWSINEIQDAWQLASQLHDGQKYGGANQEEQVEYINHIGSVVFEIMTAITIEDGMDSNLAIKCAVLHDTIEDTSLSYDDILTRFGSQVANGVLALTKNATIEGKKEKMLDSLKRIKEQPKEIWAIKMADRIANLYAPPFYWTNEKKKEYIEEACLIHDELKEGNKYLATRLANKIIEYQKFID
ncbi:HD domain-containing protein [Sporocytophaga myxococcoides]|uniref:HD domain-containing protein n=1 Tax=Sporocytophaga myxococcoides TaxID=153721 RepID=UPI0003FBFFD1|nr:HD domain-containing protein [Sporocytophaga myxococcoides]